MSWRLRSSRWPWRGWVLGLVVLLVVGWAVGPLVVAGCVAVLPLSAIVGARFALWLLDRVFHLQDDARPHTQAAIGALCIGCGVLTLGWLPHTSLAWTLGPPFVAGLGFRRLPPLQVRRMPVTST